MPQDYQRKIPQFDATTHYTTQQHVNKMKNYFELHEINDVDVQMRLFVQILDGEVKKWFKGLNVGSITNLAVFHKLFLNRWEKKKNPLQILSVFESIKGAPNETIQDYCTRYNNIYNAIPANLKPPPKSVIIKFPNGFDTDIAYQLREINPETLEQMQSNVVSVEANLLARRARMRNVRRVTIEDEPSTSYSNIDS